jgi:type II secretory ATPase GspE/PulE/Tfp pilus assembly ATPase PilB-like protein
VTVESIVKEALTADPEMVAALKDKADEAIKRLADADPKTRWQAARALREMGVRAGPAVPALAGTIEARAIDGGMTTLRQDAIRKLVAGETTIEEVCRVTQQDMFAEEMAAV